MSTDKGWIRLYRDIENHDIWNHKPYSFAHAWMDLILSAEYQDSTTVIRNKTFKVKRGQLSTSLRKLAEKWGWGQKTVINYLSELKKRRMIRLKQDNFGTIITIVNYEKYQGAIKNTASTQKRYTASPTEAQKEHFPIIKERKEIYALSGKDDATASDEDDNVPWWEKEGNDNTE